METIESETQTRYRVAGRLLEVCTCKAICPCWVGDDPDGGICESSLAWHVDAGMVEGVDVSDLTLGLSVHVPGNILTPGSWKAVLYVDDRATDAQQGALLKVFTGQLGGAVADLAALIGEVVAIERAPITFTVREGEGIFQIGDAIEARLAPFQGTTGTTTLNDSVFSTVPGSPAYPGKASVFRRREGSHGMADIDISGHNAVQGTFLFEA